MNAIDIAKGLYAQHGMSLAQDIGQYLDHGGVFFCTPDRLIIGRPVRVAEPDAWPAPGAADAWYVRLAVTTAGRGMRWFVEQMPYFLPWCCWHRHFRLSGGPLHVRPTSTLCRVTKGMHHG